MSGASVAGGDPACPCAVVVLSTSGGAAGDDDDDDDDDDDWVRVLWRLDQDL